MIEEENLRTLTRDNVNRYIDNVCGGNARKCTQITARDWPARRFEKIGDEAFKDFPNLREVVIPEGVVEIGRFAFENCPKLRSVKLPSTLKTIDHAAFYRCYALSEIEFPDQIETLEKLAFAHTGFWYLPEIPQSLSGQIDIMDNDPFIFTPFWYRGTGRKLLAVICFYAHKIRHRSSFFLRLIHWCTHSYEF